MVFAILYNDTKVLGISVQFPFFTTVSYEEVDNEKCYFIFCSHNWDSFCGFA
jgi:hypothetical protein